MTTRSGVIDVRVVIAALAVGTFSIGTDGFVIAGILPEIAETLGVRISEAGLLVTIFAFVYGLSAPIAGAVVPRFGRRKLLTYAMLAFSAANLLAALAPSYALLAVARILAAVSAAAYSPVAVAAAVQLSPPEQRGRASSLVYGGLTLSLVTGVPLGSMLAQLGSWRTTFHFVAALAALSALAIWMLVPPTEKTPAISLRARLAPLRRPVVVTTLLSGFVWMTGGILVYTYISPIVVAATGWPIAAVSPILFLYGLSAIVGNLVSGRLSDGRLGPRLTLASILTLHGASLVAIGLATCLGPPVGKVLGPVAIALFAASGWACTPPQASRLIALAPTAAVEMLSLSTMATYLGIASGAALGGVVLNQLGVEALGFAGAIAQLIALLGVLAFDSKSEPLHPRRIPAVQLEHAD